MSIINLYDRLIGKSTISLDQSGLGDDGQTLFATLHNLTDEPLTLNVSVGPKWKDATKSGFTVKGVSQQPLLGMQAPPLTLDVSADGDIIHYRIIIETTNDWNFGKTFPQLINTEMSLLSPGNVLFILATSGSSEEQLSIGLNFKGNLQLINTVILTAIEEFITGTAALLPIKGTIQKYDNYQLLTIRAQIKNGSASLSIANFLDFGFSNPDLALYAYIYKEGESVVFFKRIEAIVTLNGTSGNPVTLPLALQLPTSVTGWQIMLQPDQDISLSDFLEFLALIGSAGQFNLMDVFTGPLATVKDVLKALLLEQFSVEITGSLNSAPHFRSFSFLIRQQTATAWNIIPDKLALMNLQVYFNITKEISGYQTAGFIRGELAITETIAISASIPIPVGSGDWQFFSSHSVPLSDLNILSKFTDGFSITSLLPESLVQALSGLTLKELMLVYNPGTGIKQLRFVINMSEHWTIIQDSFELVSLNLSFKLEKGTNGWGLAGSIQSVLLAGGITIDTQISKPVADADWSFDLSADSIPLPGLSALSRLIGGENALDDVLPDSLLNAQLYLNSPRLDFDLSQRKLTAFGFSLAMDEIDFDGVKILEAGISVDIIFGVARDIKIFGKLLISDIDVYVEGASLDTGGWQFSGQAARGNSIQIGDLIVKLATRFGITSDAPAAIKGLTVSNLLVSFNTQTKDLSFSIETEFPIDNKELDAVINIDITHNNDKYSREFSGIVKVGDLEFDLVFDQEQDTGTIFLAAFENKSGKYETIRPLVALITDDTDILNAANGISFNLKDALLVIDKGTTTKILFGLDIGGGLDISNLPLVGKMLPENATLRMTFQPLLTNDDFLAADINKVRPLVPSGGFQLPQEAKGRLGFNTQLMIGEQKFDLSLPIGVNDVKSQPPTTTTPPVTPTVAPPANTANIKWFVIQKQLGPVTFGRVGVQFQDSRLYFFLDASLSLAGLTISLDGLFASSTLNPIQPAFGLHGLGIDYKNDPLEIGGTFLRQTITDTSGNTYDTYDGTAIIRTEKFALAALGSYAYYQGHPSLFIYAFVDVPLGGPAFFFVTGLAAGFGYNRRVMVPTLEGIRTFPLVEQVFSGPPDTTQGLSGVINQLHEVIPPATGEYFLAAGIRFSSFKIIDSFLLLMVRFGTEFEVDILGLSTLVLPTPDTGSLIEPLAEIQLALQAVFNPSKGYLKVQAGLTAASFLLSRNCHLTGGFAFYTWFKDSDDGASAGDFALTIGGYHPRFKPPAYYPRVAPLGFNWQVIPELIIKGDFYFALLPSAVMAGGYLSATWTSGNLSAWFNIGADFIISWKPYFYDADMYVDMGASYTFHLFGTHHISVDVGADLHIWGPEFSGKAHVHLYIITFDVRFGANDNLEPEKLSWEEFRQSFLPDNSKWENTSITNGLVKKLGTDDAPLFIVNPKDFAMETSSAIPVSASNQTLSSDVAKINIGSMGIDDNSIFSSHNITILLGSVDVTTDFTFAPVVKYLPSALWGPIFKHSENETEDERLIKNACTGFSIKGKPVTPSANTHDVATEKLLDQDEFFNSGNPVAFSKPLQLNGAWLKTTGVRNLVSESIELVADGERRRLLKSLNIREDYYPNKELADEFILSSVL
ncbi:hypothetical protein SAMN05518672_103599 [Chitinophaga sp. CF118]|uniref:DUF6603 domain-containing protein n=1 Tax=Chitinophaga sp. CF118 TaxID=1884367 RepID=UPI0008ED715B|nr:DUF6603 domain-containing protein [Chitinophaga sp. CF118]SFD86832.1 hypothetical protein SAMN05518672_103599 [Chitinophaga sp. CF118]